MSNRSVALLAAILSLIGLQFFANSSTALALPAFIDDDNCGMSNANPYYFAEGPAIYWHAAHYTGGPSGIGGVCELWTQNVPYYLNINADNSSYWYLPISPANTWSGNYEAWAFEPTPNATTKQAVYEYWPYGHNRPYPDGLCSVNQASLFNVYAQLCGADLPNNHWYICADVNAGCGGFWRLTDATGEPNLSTKVASEEFAYCPGGFCSQGGFGLNYSSYLGVSIRVDNSAGGGRCLDADTNTIGGNGTKVQLWDCSGAKNQHWNRLSDSTIRNVWSGRCLDADTNTIGANGTKVQLWDCNGWSNQAWYRAGDGTLRNGWSARCLDADTNTIGANGTKVQLWDCSGALNQKWLPV